MEQMRNCNILPIGSPGKPGVPLALVGAGSTAFHGTLLFAGQAADELAMVYCVVAFLLVQLGSRRVTLSVCLVYLPAFTWVHLRLYIRGLAS